MDAIPNRKDKNTRMAACIMVLNGVVIGDDEALAANAVVRSHVPAQSIVVGVPVWIIGYRRVSS